MLVGVIDARTRRLQIALGTVWLLDGILQLQPSMFRATFITDVLAPSASGQPGLIAHSVSWSTALVAHHWAAWNVVFAALQLAIGAGLLFRRTVRPALVASVVWGLLVWWFAEGAGMLFMGMASPLTGAPGAALLYAAVSVLIWPGAASRRRAIAGRAAWATFWVGTAVLWLLPANRAADSVASAIGSSTSGEPGPVARPIIDLARAAAGHGALLAVVLAAASVAIGLGALSPRSRPFLWAGVAVSAAFWVVGQGFGGILTGQATDPNAAPLVVLMALAALPAVPRPATAASTPVPVGRPLPAAA